MSTSATDVVVTGLGATTPLGGDVDTTWDVCGRAVGGPVQPRLLWM